jgi:hypothetical protein
MERVVAFNFDTGKRLRCIHWKDGPQHGPNHRCEPHIHGRDYGLVALLTRVLKVVVVAGGIVSYSGIRFVSRDFHSRHSSDEFVGVYQKDEGKKTSPSESEHANTGTTYRSVEFIIVLCFLTGLTTDTGLTSS